MYGGSGTFYFTLHNIKYSLCHCGLQLLLETFFFRLMNINETQGNISALGSDVCSVINSDIMRYSDVSKLRQEEKFT
jgi:hypothetical protein